jgi:hypothetical protein
MLSLFGSDKIEDFKLQSSPGTGIQSSPGTGIK